MGPASTIALLLVVLSSCWVYIDAQNLRSKMPVADRDRTTGPGVWLVACILLWIVCFPLYLFARRDYREIGIAVQRRKQEERRKQRRREREKENEERGLLTKKERAAEAQLVSMRGRLKFYESELKKPLDNESREALWKHLERLASDAKLLLEDVDDEDLRREIGAFQDRLERCRKKDP